MVSIISISGPEVLLLMMFAVLLAGAVVIVAVRSSRSTAPSPPTGYPPATRIDEIERLAKLHADGALSDEEFQREKRRILGS